MLLDEIREGAAWVAAQADQVRIDHDRLRAYAAALPVAEIGRPDDDPGRHRHGDDETTAAFVLALDAVNFGSGTFPWLRKRPGMSGYWTVATGLEEHVAAHGLSADALAALTTPDCAHIFGQELDGGPAHWLMDRFADALGELGRTVGTDHDGSFLGFVASAGGDAEALVTRLAALPTWADTWDYRGRSVPVFKRAQIAAYDLAVAFGHQGPGALAGLDRLTMFADNLVPHVLHLDEVLRFAPELVARIEAVEDITAGSAAEVEIRCVALHAVELLVGELHAAGHTHVTAGALDGWLWNRGAGPTYKAVPRHRTRTTAY
jgi:hypothetical protein